MTTEIEHYMVKCSDLSDRVAELEASIAKGKAYIKESFAKNVELMKENERLRGAVKVYANSLNWCYIQGHGWVFNGGDPGRPWETAREGLEKGALNDKPCQC